MHWPTDAGCVGILVFLNWRSSFSLINGLDACCSARRLTAQFLFCSVPVSEGIEIRQGCRFIRSLVRALGKLPGGLGRFLPCTVGSHMSRLRGLTSRPLERCHHQCLEAVCGEFGGIPLVRLRSF